MNRMEPNKVEQNRSEGTKIEFSKSEINKVQQSKIKICGLSRPKDIDTVNYILPDYIGFVFAPSRRRVSVETAKALKENLNPAIKVVGVFVNEDLEHIISLCNSHIIDIIQLHGDEDENYMRALRNDTPNEIIKAVRVKTSEDIISSSTLPCDYLLLDAYHEEQYGGSGKTFDWSLISHVSKPYFLAGGIDSNNILQAQKQCTPFCIDVSSGVETDGYKDPAKIIEIVTKIRSVK